MKNLCLYFFTLILTGCAWNPKLPPHTYQGIVYNEPLKRPEPRAIVGASRNGGYIVPALVESESLGGTHSDQHGHFSLTTRTGYAQTLSATTTDGRMGGQIEKGLTRNNARLVIPIRPSVTTVSFSVEFPPRDLDRQRSAIDKILFHYASTSYRHRYSISDYAAKGVISAKERDSFLPYSPYIFTPHPRITYHWAHEQILFPSLTTKFVLKKSVHGLPWNFLTPQPEPWTPSTNAKPSTKNPSAPSPTKSSPPRTANPSKSSAIKTSTTSSTNPAPPSSDLCPLRFTLPFSS